jgi:hypothetical protein
MKKIKCTNAETTKKIPTHNKYTNDEMDTIQQGHNHWILPR